MVAALAITLSSLAPHASHAELSLPRPSPKATVAQTIGLTNFTVTYSRPGVKGRKIWDGLVPYGEVWRTGANEATTFECSDAVTIAGKPLAAGTYSFYTLPGPNEWDVIFSHAKGAWGSSEYTREKDALRIKVKPGAGPMQEWMSFSFENLSTTSGDLVLRWEKLQLVVPITVDSDAKAMASIRSAMAELKADDWQTPYRAAQYCFNNNLNADEALKWAEQSVTTKPAYFNLSLLADMRMKAGKTQEAIETAQKAIDAGKADPDKPDTRPTEKKLAEWKTKKG
jgi:hypothetical protein